MDENANTTVDAQESSPDERAPSPDAADTAENLRDDDGYAPGADPWDDDDDDFALDPADFPDPDNPGGEDGGDAAPDEAPAAPEGRNAPPQDAARPEAGQTGPEPAAPASVPLADLEADAQQEARYQTVIRDLVNNEGYTLSVARLAAAAECGGKHYAVPSEFLADAAAPAGQSAPAAPAAPAPAQGQDLMTQIRLLRTMYPDITEMPGEVMDQVRAGSDLPAAYAAFRSKSDAETIRALREENARLKQHADARSRAPVRGVTGSQARQTGRDPAMEAFDREWDD